MIKGVGVDIIEVERIQQAMDRWGMSFIEHIFNEEEIAYAKGRKNPAQHYAARFAAKEAVYKAFGDNPTITWKKISILNDKHGKPCCILKDKKIKNTIHISLSHTENYAVANAIITT